MNRKQGVPGEKTSLLDSENSVRGALDPCGDQVNDSACFNIDNVATLNLIGARHAAKIQGHQQCQHRRYLCHLHLRTRLDLRRLDPKSWVTQSGEEEMSACLNCP